jgi:uncharacterized membrane protein
MMIGSRLFTFRERPLLLILLIGTQLLGAASLFLFGGMVLIDTFMAPAAESLIFIGTIASALVLMLLGSITTVITLGLWQRYRWAYYIQVGLTSITLLVNITNYFTDGTVRMQSLVTSTGILAILLLPGTRKAFFANPHT